MDRDARLFQLGQRLKLLGLALGRGQGDVGRAGGLDRELLLLVQTAPNVLVDDEGDQRGLLVPAGEVVVAGVVVHRHGLVDQREADLGGVDGAQTQAGQRIGDRHRLRLDAQLLHHVCAKPEDPHLHALKGSCHVNRVAIASLLFAT